MWYQCKEGAAGFSTELSQNCHWVKKSQGRKVVIPEFDIGEKNNWINLPAVIKEKEDVV